LVGKSHKGEAKTEIGGIAKGILKLDKVNNFQNHSNVISVGGTGQPSKEDLHNFVLKLADNIDTEIGGLDFAAKGLSDVSSVFIGAYKAQGEQPNDAKNDYSKFDRPDLLQNNTLNTYFHTHLSRFGENERLNAAPADIDRKNALLGQGLKSAIILTSPEGPQEFIDK
jgi:hypothetical protein